MGDFYDRNGNPMTLDEWGTKLRDNDYKRVALDTINGVDVSTVWLGLDHGYDGNRKIFETMVFGGELDEEQQRYGTIEEARAGHAEMVARVKGETP